MSLLKDIDDDDEREVEEGEVVRGEVHDAAEQTPAPQEEDADDDESAERTLLPAIPLTPPPPPPPPPFRIEGEEGEEVDVEYEK